MKKAARASEMEGLTQEQKDEIRMRIEVWGKVHVGAKLGAWQDHYHDYFLSLMLDCESIAKIWRVLGEPLRLPPLLIFQEVKKARVAESAAKRERMLRALQGGGGAPDLVIDLDFDGMMSDSDLKHLFQQAGGGW